MKIVNCMIARRMGGVEQAFLDYEKALLLKHFEVMTVTDSKACINRFLEQIQPENLMLKINFSQFNLFAFIQLYFKLRLFKPDIVITHSKKLLAWFIFLKKILKFKLVVTAHNPKLKHLNKADFIFTITTSQKEHFIRNGFSQDRIFVIPNMYSELILPYKTKISGDIITIGTFGRFDPQKGFSDYIKALHLLDEYQIPFQAVLGGDATPQYESEKDKIIHLIEEYHLENKVKLTGWVTDKKAFFDKFDIFVLPSRHEPFGIVLLEAMAAGKPIISSLCEGPKEIFSGSNAAMLYPCGDYHALADGLKCLIENKNRRDELGRAGYQLLIDKYSLKIVSCILERAVSDIARVLS